MLKIPTIFAREVGRSNLVVNFKTENIDWMWEGFGLATRKWDGLAVLVKNRKLYKRITLRNSSEVHDDFIPCGAPDPVTGYRVGWVPVTDSSGDIWYHDAPVPKMDGTYELCGPRIRGNPERFEKQVFMHHGLHVLNGVPRDYDGLHDYLRVTDIEGIVWHRGNGDLCKIKKIDFGFRR